MIATAIYVSGQTRLYEARGALEIPRTQIRDHVDMVPTVFSFFVDRSRANIDTAHAVLNSRKMQSLVIDRFSVEDRKAFFWPYGLADDSDDFINRRILANRILVIDSKTRTVEIRYRHPDRYLATRIVDFFLQEAVASNASGRISDADIAYYQKRVEEMEQQVQNCERAVVTYRESRSELRGDELEKDKQYQVLVKNADEEKGLYKMDKMNFDRIARMQALEKYEADAWRISLLPTTPDEGEYLLAPLIVTAAWGAAIAVMTGVLAAVIFKRRAVSEKTAACQV
ncbi:hypothetical protein [Rariglobus hedericola]|uniref:Uncharacterized protein n=1 Tax=Rariglobus hedericola TaxID=2597822 RepID=A0A556QR16_9BACT|nr:hypothetical protein [Rariglobus hedericola]TSJ79073.1 hypothetical protein FPL22_07200 [Rariglobus hedericola]